MDIKEESSLLFEKMVEGDVFRIIVPLDEMYSFDYSQNIPDATKRNDDATLEGKSATMKCDFETIEHHPETKEILSREEEKILLLIKENPFITQRMLQEKTGISLGTIKRILPRLQEKNVLVREGGKRFGKWLINHTKDNEVQHG